MMQLENLTKEEGYELYKEFYEKPILENGELKNPYNKCGVCQRDVMIEGEVYFMTSFHYRDSQTEKLIDVSDEETMRFLYENFLSPQNNFIT